MSLDFTVIVDRLGLLQVILFLEKEPEEKRQNIDRLVSILLVIKEHRTTQTLQMPSIFLVSLSRNRVH